MQRAPFAFAPAAAAVARMDLLVVEDDDAFAQFVATTLSECGHALRLVATCADARTAVAARAPDLIIVDGVLPDGSGLDLIAELRGGGFAGPVLFLSAYWRHAGALVDTARSLRLSGTLHKPISRGELLAHVDAALSRLPSSTTPPSHGGLPALPAIERLRQSFAASIGGRLDRLRDALLRCAEHDPVAESDLAQALALAHQLHGTSGSFGFTAVSVEAGGVEFALRAVQAGEAAADAVLWRRLQEAVSRARRAAVAPTTAALPPQQPLAAVRPPGSGDRVLWLQCDGATAGIGAKVARQLGIELGVVATLEDATRELAQGTFAAAVIVGDVAEQTFAHCRGLRATTGNEALPVAVSAPATADDNLLAIQSGARLVLSPAPTAEELSTALLSLLRYGQTQRTSVLLLDDDATFADFVAFALRAHGVRIEQRGDANDLLETLDRIRPAMVIADVVMPGLSGFDVCRLIRSCSRFDELPIMLATAFNSLDVRVAAFEAGADDYMTKPVLEVELLARVLPRLERIRLSRDRRDRDNLTGLLSRRAFTEQFHARWSAERRRDEPVALAMLDIDHFKSINDERGHLVGDEVLRALGSFLNERYRAEDLRARWGGEEFVVAFFGEGADTARRLIQRALVEFAARRFVDSDGATFQVSFTAGIAEAPVDGDGLFDLLRAADARLYQSKRAGRARVM